MLTLPPSHPFQMSPISVGDDKQPLVAPDENFNKFEHQDRTRKKSEEKRKISLVPEFESKQQNITHAKLKAALSLPIPQSNGLLVKKADDSEEDWDPEMQEGRKRSRSEILSGKSHTSSSEDISSPSRRLLDKEHSTSVQSLVGKALKKEGIRLTENDPLVRVAEQEIKEAFDVSTDELNEAAEKLLSEIEDNINQNCDFETLKEEGEESHQEEQVTTSPWRSGLRNIPESSVVVTDL